MKKLFFLTALLPVLLFGCDDDTTGASVGAAGQACYPNATCNAGLTCTDGVCAGSAGGVGGAGQACYPNGTCNAGLTCTAGTCAGGPPSMMDGGSAIPDATIEDGMVIPGDGSIPPGTDGGMCAADMSSSLTPPIPDACLPRCTVATQAAMNACDESWEMDPEMFDLYACQTMALEGDPTPAVMYTDSSTAEGFSYELNCQSCFWMPVDVCNDQFCPMESPMARDCVGTLEECQPKYDALDACVAMNVAAHQSCIDMNQARCFIR